MNHTTTKSCKSTLQEQLPLTVQDLHRSLHSLHAQVLSLLDSFVFLQFESVISHCQSFYDHVTTQYVSHALISSSVMTLIEHHLSTMSHNTKLRPVKHVLRHEDHVISLRVPRQLYSDSEASHEALLMFQKLVSTHSNLALSSSLPFRQHTHEYMQKHNPQVLLQESPRASRLQQDALPIAVHNATTAQYVSQSLVILDLQQSLES
mmetsp:Transcript_11434/g.20683  ORF Transcript_11434/g.20683 Transcript_11434/m.20683 type:complete len:206 (+) Transcript_11434:3573-4190(+)